MSSWAVWNIITCVIWLYLYASVAPESLKGKFTRTAFLFNNWTEWTKCDLVLDSQSVIMFMSHGCFYLFTFCMEDANVSISVLLTECFVLIIYYMSSKWRCWCAFKYVLQVWLTGRGRKIITAWDWLTSAAGDFCSCVVVVWYLYSRMFVDALKDTMVLP